MKKISSQFVETGKHYLFVMDFFYILTVGIQFSGRFVLFLITIANNYQ